MTTDLRRGAGGLGRGLEALIPQREAASGTVELPISAIGANPYQPRAAVEEAALAQLAQSIAEHGVLQPILVTQTADGYRLVAGERRLRAAQMAGLERVPALVRSVGEQDQLAYALVENLQRADLNALEEARAFRQLVDEFGLSHEEIARRMGRSRSAVANTLRLLDLAPAVQEALASGALSEGHARALAGLDGAELQAEAMRQVLGRGLSVRRTEELVRRLRDQSPARPRRPRAVSADLERVERGLREALSTKVTLSTARRGGRITIEWYDEDDLTRIYDRLTGGRDD